MVVYEAFKALADPSKGSSAGTMSEWPPSYGPKPPFNNLTKTAGGHSIEMDDTPGAERVQITHRSGSHIEMRPDGSVKYKSVKNRQDITIGDSEVIIQGDFNITVDGGIKILSRNGALEIQSDYGAAINVKGELKVSADNILMKAKKKISLLAPYVDIGNAPKNPWISLPYSYVPVFGVPIVTMAGLPVPTTLAGAAIPIPSGTGLGAVPSLLTSLTSVATQINTLRKYAAKGAGIAAIKLIKDSKGVPLVPEIDQPDEIPLTNPRLYTGTSIDRVRLRDRQFDTPDDADDTESYTAHLDLCERVKDLVAGDKDLPGQLLANDAVDANGVVISTRDPLPEPHPAKAFALENGTVSCTQGDRTVAGSGTKFLQELQIGQTLVIRNTEVMVAAVQNDTSLVLSTAWSQPSTTNASVHVFMLRPFSEFMDKYTYPLTTKLGTSSLTLRDMMVNYIPPTIEKVDVGVPVPSIPVAPTQPIGGGNSDGGGGVSDNPPREPYDPNKQESV